MTTPSETTSVPLTVNIINWFEIPVTDLAKASCLYEAMLNMKLEHSMFGGIPHAVISNQDRSGVSGSLVSDPKRKPVRGAGPLIYLDAADGVARALARAVEAGARIVQPLTEIPPHGTIAVIEDLDGNLIGLHTNPAA